MGKPFETLAAETIFALHRMVIEHDGGLYSNKNHNMLNPSSLEYAMEAILFPMFGKELYPTVFDKVALLIHAIICSHVFRDGNKRTALAVCKATLDINGFDFHLGKEVEDFFVKISAESLPADQIAAWIKKHARLRVR